MSTINQQIIIGGSYAKSGTGNFNARTVSGATFFVPAQMMTDLGYQKDEQPTFPLFGFSTTKQIGVFIPGTTDVQMQEDGVTPVQVDREEITALFKDKPSFIAVANAGFGLELEIRADRATLAKSAGLTDDAIESLLAVTI